MSPLTCLCRFEAGTPAIAEAIGLGAACEYLTSLGMENVAAYEQQLGTYLYEQVHSTGFCAHTVGKIRPVETPANSALQHR